MYFWFLQVSQKTNEKNSTLLLWCLKSNCFCLFLGELKTPKRHFKINWTISKALKNCFNYEWSLNQNKTNRYLLKNSETFAKITQIYCKCKHKIASEWSDLKLVKCRQSKACQIKSGQIKSCQTEKLQQNSKIKKHRYHVTQKEPEKLTQGMAPLLTIG